MTNCKNCGVEFEGKYCPQCGQKAKTGRITFRQVVGEVRSHFIHFEQGFLYTIKELILRPGHTIREYLEGKRVRHVKPLKFMFWTTAIGFLATHYLGVEAKLLQNIQATNGTESVKPQEGQKLVELLMGHPNLLLLSIIPGIALCSWLLFRKKRYNYAEHITANAYILGQLSLLNIPISIGVLLSNDMSVARMAIYSSIQWIFWMIYFAWSYGQWMNSPKKAWDRIKGVLVLLLGYMVMILIIATLATFALSYFKPEVESFLKE